jgi:FtsP/CotA-like multicopper oxidase with cupredoxin domain
MRRTAACIIILLATPLVRSHASPASMQLPGWDNGIRLPEAADLNPDPHVVEINLESKPAQIEVAPGSRVEAWTYNGGVPGPLIRVHVGDRLIVHFTNHLPQPTTVHWHGLRIPIAMDGVPGVSQPEVAPGGTFTYDFIVPDAGLFWYHPHVMSAAQVGFGLYGALLVDDPAEQVGVTDELVLVLSDIGFDKHGVLDSPTSGGSTAMVFGREGEYVLVNGRVHPTITVRSGARQRWRIVNAAKSRYFHLELDDHAFTRIGGDGGLQERPEQLETLLLAPGERADAIVTPTAPANRELVLRALLYDRGYGSVEYRQPEDLMTLIVSKDAPARPDPLPDIHRAIAPAVSDGATAVSLTLGLGQRSDRVYEYQINGVPFLKDKPLKAALGERQVWTIVNDTKWSHPFHLHGFFFQVLDDRGVPVRPLAWKDTVNVPYGKSARFIVRFDDRPGSWMFHCHILDHADGGLMGMVDVGDGPATSHTHGIPKS